MNTDRINLRASREKWPLPLLLRRGVWEFFLEPFARLLPRPFNRLRIALLRAAGAEIGKHCLIMPGVKVLMPWNLHLDECVAVGRDVEFYNHARIYIGSHTVVSQRSFLCTSSHDYTASNMPLIYADIAVGSECWIAAEAYLGPGVKIGNGSVIAARSVVTKPMPPWMVCAGNPCRPIKQRVLGSVSSR